MGTGRSEFPHHPWSSVSEAAQVSNPVSVSASLVQELEAPEWYYYGNMHNEEAKVSHDLPLRLSAHTAIELWHPGASAPKNPTMIYLCGGKERTGDVKSHVGSITQLKFECVIIDPKTGGYAQDIRRPEVCKALAEYLQAPNVFLILASPDCKWFCALRGAGSKEGKCMPSGPGVLFNKDYPDGDVDAAGEVKPEAKEALLMWGICFFLMEAACKAEAEVIIEQPVWRGAGSPHAIPGKEWHSTIFHTEVGKKAVSSMQLKEIPFDQGAEPINAPTQKTTSLWCTKKVYPLVMNKFGSLKTTMQSGTLKTPRQNESGAFSTSGSEAYPPAMCELLAEVAHELLKKRRLKIIIHLTGLNFAIILLIVNSNILMILTKYLHGVV